MESFSWRMWGGRMGYLTIWPIFFAGLIESAPVKILTLVIIKFAEEEQRLSMMVDNVKLEPLSVQFCGESMLEAQIDLCSTISISIPYPTVNPARLRPVYPVYVSGIPGVPGIIYRSVWPVNSKSNRHIYRHGFSTSVRSSSFYRNRVITGTGV